MGSLDDAAADNTTQETTLATIRSVSGDWDNSTVRTEMHTASGDWDNATVNATSVSGISAIANTNSSQGYGHGSYSSGQETLNKNVLEEWVPSEESIKRALIAKKLSRTMQLPLIISGGKTIENAPDFSTEIASLIILSFSNEFLPKTL